MTFDSNWVFEFGRMIESCKCNKLDFTIRDWLAVVDFKENIKLQYQTCLPTTLTVAAAVTTAAAAVVFCSSVAHI